MAMVVHMCTMALTASGSNSIVDRGKQMSLLSPVREDQEALRSWL